MSAADAVRLVGALAAGVTLLVLARLIRHLRILRRHELSAHALPGTQQPLVSVLVPARNEERGIAPCLASLLAQDYPNLEVLVWDDASEDTTLEVARRLAARDPRLAVHHGEGPPAGWIGKCYALDRLAAQARGEWLLFTDADTVHARDSVATGLAYALDHGLEALSCSGQGVLGSFWEKAWEPLWPAFLFYWLPPDRLADPDAPLGFAVGQWLLVHRPAYERLGGHRAVRAEIVEDCALARRLKERRIPFRVCLSTPLFQVRMYRSLGEIWQGWSKNSYRLFGLLGRGPLAALLSPLVLALVTVVPFLILASGLAGLVPGLGPLATWGPAAFALGVSALVRAYRRSNPGYFWTLPLAGAVAAGVLVNSTLRTVLRLPVGWKGRAYPGGAPPA